MRLLVHVCEGDLVEFYGAYGSRFAWTQRAMDSFRGAFDPFLSPADGDSSARWRELHDSELGDAFEISVPASMTVAECLALALREARRTGAAQPDEEPAAPAEGFPWHDRVLRTWLADPVTDEEYEPGLSLERTGLADGDLIVLCIERTAQGAYCLAPAPNPAVLLERLQLAMNGSAPDGGPRLWGVLLYTTADGELATYVRTHFEDLDALSGPSTRVFVVERQARWAEARAYWRGRLEPELYRVLSSMRWLRWQPYEPQGAYAIADRLGVAPELLPCLVFFDGRPEQPWGGRRIVFPVEQATPQYFRTLFGRVARVLGTLPAQDGARRPGEEFGPLDLLDLRADIENDSEAVLGSLLNSARGLDDAAFATVAAAEHSIRAALRPAPAPSTDYHLDNCRVVLTSGSFMTENFYFQGQNTTFINRPVHTVVRDFQNQYGEAPGHEELRQLLQLTLSSADLADSDRDEAARTVHDLARLADDPASDASAFRLRAERLREMLAGAADIAQPALAIIASVVAAVTG
ncbi:hypothetical protein [Streptomyces sp. NPDC057718]|uniref:hypothetical protein n=1 Tax=Streptomyces sp. NPDC057718 TaxID=3346225 RepID=UPI0036B5CF9F